MHAATWPSSRTSIGLTHANVAPSCASAYRPSMNAWRGTSSSAARSVQPSTVAIAAISCSSSGDGAILMCRARQLPGGATISFSASTLPSLSRSHVDFTGP